MATEMPTHEDESASFPLLELPGPCLLAVMQFLAANDKRSLFIAARAHSELHQAAVGALRSFTAHVFTQQKVDSVLLYLHKHGCHVDSMGLIGRETHGSALTASLRQLPPMIQLSNLLLDGFRLQLQPGDGFQGVLGPAVGATSLKRLALKHCELCESGHAAEGLAAALAQLPSELEHLSIRQLSINGEPVQFPTTALERLQQLTYLQLSYIGVKGPNEDSPALQPLRALTRLVDLQIQVPGEVDSTITQEMLAGTHQLTRLRLTGLDIEPDALAGKTQLQHLDLENCYILADMAGLSQLLSHLHCLHQMTHLSLENNMYSIHVDKPPAAAFTALAASSKLRHLAVCGCTLPVDVWQHVFPIGRHLPYLTCLNISGLRDPDSQSLAAPESSRLVSCCPGLQTLDIVGLQYRAETLATLSRLSGLHALSLGANEDTPCEGLQAVCQLTGLRQLWLQPFNPMDEGLLLQLSQLKQLTLLDYYGPMEGAMEGARFMSTGPDSEPVWRKILQHHLHHGDPAVAQQAATALAE